MRKKSEFLLLVLFVLSLAGCAAFEGGWQKTFAVDLQNLTPTGRNPYFSLETGHQLTLQHEQNKQIITVLDQTKMVDGVITRVVEEREFEDGQLKEVSLNYYAMDKTTNSLYYFGEDVDLYENNQVVGHEGVWLSGVNGAKFGLFLPGEPKVGDKFYQEYAPGAALDRAEIVGLGEEVVTPAGVFRNCLHLREENPLDGGVDHKWFAPGVGVIQDENLVLTSYTGGM